jgi:hypothetical protein
MIYKVIPIMCVYLNLIFLWHNSQFSRRIITQSSNSSLNYENYRFSPQTFATGSISSLNYKNGHFGPQTFAYSSNSSLVDSQIPFFTFLLSLRTSRCWWIRAVGRPPLRWSRGLPPPSLSAPTPHPWPASTAVTSKIRAHRRRMRCRHGRFGGEQAARLEGSAFAEMTAAVMSRGFPSS